MPVTTTYPGVYVQELPSPVKPIIGVPTSVTAFVGSAPQGVLNTPIVCGSWSDYENNFGSLDENYPMSYAVYMFFMNGGAQGLVVRYETAAVATYQAVLSADITLDASSPGAWAAGLSAQVDTDNLLPPTTGKFNLSVLLGGQPVETYRALSVTKGTPTYIGTKLQSSQYVQLDSNSKPATVPEANTFTFEAPAAPAAPAAGAAAPAAAAGPAPAGGGDAPAAAAPAAAPSIIGDADAKTGIYALLKADIFNILCLPHDPNVDVSALDLGGAIAFCTQQRAMLLIDPPTAWSNHAGPLDFNTVVNTDPIPYSENAAVYYPNLITSDSSGAPLTLGPCGAVAGVWSQTDISRGVWKAPGGTATSILGLTDLAAHIDDTESGVLNPIAVNALRTMPEVGPVVWGVRTTKGADETEDQYKYISVRRTALFIEESLRRGTQWAVFEPNDEPLWSSLRLNVTTFMQGLFQQGAFQGATASDAYLVQCDTNNNPQSSIDQGIVNILVGFAPLKPAEFVIISIQQQAGQS